MNRKNKKTVAVLMVLLQIVCLLPFTAMIPTVSAEEGSVNQQTSMPALNEMIVGTVRFQSFNFLGDNLSGSDGVDYNSTFYYTDDFFSPSAMNPNATGKSEKWTTLTETELSLASTSFDLTAAAYASNVNNVLNPTNRSWDNTDYSGKDNNAQQMLETCGFEHFESYETYDQAPTNDSIAYVIASKKIHVWDDQSQSNRDFTLIAVAVRGAGYGAEWASNVTIGNPSTESLPSNGRHYGFEDAANKVCNGIQSYITSHNITQDAKYWITGYSRAGATANLVAGYVTDGAASIYHTRQRDVYGYTWECPQAAAANEDAFHYTNIHNIINAMDAVPKVSPDEFEHQRLGVDYVMPYYGNTSANENTKRYDDMRSVLKTIAVGARDYAGADYTEDPLINITDPANYPYNRAMTIHTITAGQLIGDAVDGKLMDNFGTVAATGSANKLGTNIYIDKFIDNLINVFLVSHAWDRDYSRTSDSVLVHRTRFMEKYQNDFRNVLGYLLDYSGPAFLGMVDAMVDAVGEQLSISNLLDNGGLALAFSNFYSYPNGTYKLGIPPFIDPWIGNPLWVGKTRKNVLIDEAKPVVRNVVRNMTGDFSDPQGITRSQFESSLDHLVALVIDLYADELSRYNSNYFGTSLHYMWQILCTHEQEVVMSWIKSLDPNHNNRSYRTVTIPKKTDVKLYEFREQYGEDLSVSGAAPLVAEFKNGNTVSSLDQRICMETSGNDMTIRYPAGMDIRIDVTADREITDLTYELNDYRTMEMATALSDGENQYQTVSDPGKYDRVVDQTNAVTINSYSETTTIPLSDRDTFQIMVGKNTTYDNLGDDDTYSVNKIIYADVIPEGQIWSDGSYTPYVADAEGAITALNQIDPSITSRLGSDERMEGTERNFGNSVSMSLPVINGVPSETKWFMTDASDDHRIRMTAEDGTNIPDNLEDGSLGEYTAGDTSDVQKILKASDRVYHLYYTGDSVSAGAHPIAQVIDFNARMILATDLLSCSVKTDQSGEFHINKDKGTVTYQLKNGLEMKDSRQPASAEVITVPDQAVIAGVHAGQRAAPSRKTVNVVPASSVYFDDDLRDMEITVGDGSGYSAAITGRGTSDNSEETEESEYTFSFAGTGVDVYCTTDSETGYIMASLYQNDEIAKNSRGKNCSVLMRSSSVTTRYNVPTIRFHGLTYGSYELRLSVLKNSHYKLDGIRIYNTVNDPELYGDSPEANVKYVNLREVLLNAESDYSVSADVDWSEAESDGNVDLSKVSGVLFLDSTEELVGQSYDDVVEAYRKNGPKSEIYLAGAEANKTQGLVFRLNDPSEKQYWIGLSAPEEEGYLYGEVTVNGLAVPVRSYVDMYYPVTPVDGIIRIENTGSTLISVTNLKVSGTGIGTDSITLFAPVTRGVLKKAAMLPTVSQSDDTEISEEPEETEDPISEEEPASQTEEDKTEEDPQVTEPSEAEETILPSTEPEQKPSGKTKTIADQIRTIVRAVTSYLKKMFHM